MKKLTVPAINYLNKSWNSLVGSNAKKHVHQLEAELGAANKKIEQQATDLKRANDDLEQLAYIVSHDLKAPVRNISSFMKLILLKYGASFTGDAREFIEHSKLSAEQLSKQIDDLVSYCRVGRNLHPASTVDVEQMIKTIQAELSVKINERNAQIIVEQKLPVLHQVHSGMIHHVFYNLIDNAIKFNTNENIEVRVGSKEEDGSFKFSVTDNGIGIAPEYKGKLFQMFKRLHSDDQFEGTGTGLAVCRKIVTFYKGSIWLENEPGKGTTFYFTLPKSMDKSIPLFTQETPYSTPVLKAA